MESNNFVLGVALIGVVLSFGFMSWFAYEQSRLVGLMRKHINPVRPITHNELRDAANRLFPNGFAVAKLVIGNVLWQVRAAWHDWPASQAELKLSAKRARIAMSLAVLSVACTFLVPIAIVLIQLATSQTPLMLVK